MTEAERRAFNAGLEAAGDAIMRARTKASAAIKDSVTAAFVVGMLDEAADDLAMLVRPEPTTPEARRRSFALVQA